MAARVEIEYCTQCRWLPRAAWLAQELLGTFEGTLGEVALVPGSGGVLMVRVDGETVWDRAAQGNAYNSYRGTIAPSGLHGTFNHTCLESDSPDLASTDSTRLVSRSMSLGLSGSAWRTTSKPLPS